MTLIPTQKVVTTISSSDRRARPFELGRLAIRRAARYPFATGLGIGLTLLARAGIGILEDADYDVLPVSVLSVFAGAAIYMFLTAFMVLNENRLQHTGRIFRSGAATSCIVMAAVGLPMFVASQLLPENWQSLPEWQGLIQWWPTASLGLGIVGLWITLPAFALAFPIFANTGTPVTSCVRFVWTSIEDDAYSASRLTLFVSFIGWILLTIPGGGLLVPTLFAHLSATMFEHFIVVREDTVLE